MRILFDITHPAHVHFFRNAIRECESRGHEVTITSRDKDIAVALLDQYGLLHINLGSARSGLPGLALELLRRGWKLRRIVREKRPDVMAAIGATFIAPVGRMSRIPTLLFTDTENATLSNAIAFPCADLIVTPKCYRSPVRKRHIRYKGYHELAYLHPNYFRPDPSILDELGVEQGERFVIMRFVSWGASHDVGHSGLTLTTKRNAAKAFSEHAKVFITSETELVDDLQPYRIRISANRIHDALAYATLLYGESATMASEAAVLGTPAIFVDDAGRGYTNEQEKTFGMVSNFTESLEDQAKSIERGLDLLKRPNVKEDWKAKREHLLERCSDVTKTIVDLIEHHRELIQNVRVRGYIEL